MGGYGEGLGGIRLYDGHEQLERRVALEKGPEAADWMVTMSSWRSRGNLSPTERLDGGHEQLEKWGKSISNWMIDSCIFL